MLRAVRSVAFAVVGAAIALFAPATGGAAAQEAAVQASAAAAAGHDTGVPGPWYGFRALAVDGAALVLAGAASTDVEPDPLNVLAARA